MATRVMSNKVTMDEITSIGNQIVKFINAGEPYHELTCPRCGGTLILEEYGASHAVRCETDGCIQYTVRGI